ncbi:fatty acid desaturase [Flavimaricola marinus]|uniref:Fatty acid desaturase n=1 Tax=Flavimaricola marinus TaxID=1819565 RepID=A0A238LJN7_9RHOB|nr:fatty acid desaturase [Flavimaricola marinus]SMY09605.1 Fatty acid desaturase [Flavimaricola marinus]
MDTREFSSRYCQKDDRIAALSYFGTFAVYFLTLALAILAAKVSWWLAAPPIVVNALSGIRLYVLQHDCGHLSLWSKREWNEWAGIGLSTFTLTPFQAMQYNHNQHHAHVGDLDARRSGEIHTMTLREWERATHWERLYYRIYRNPFFLIPVGGIFTYVIRYRWPKNALMVGWRSIMAHNLALATWVAFLWLAGGVIALWVYAATVMIAACIGVFLVYLQHNFEDTYWDRKPRHRLKTAVLKGSSALDLGWWFDLATCNIAYHDLHHDNPRIPSYRLKQCHKDAREHFDLPLIHWPEALRSFRLKLWDEEQGKLVAFPPAHAHAPTRGDAQGAA